MYAPAIAEKRLSRLIDAVRAKTDPKFEAPERSIQEIESWIARLEPAWHPTKGLLRPLGRDEERFVLGEVLRSKADFTYWVTRYPKIKTKEARLERIAFLESQEIILRRIALAEIEALSGKTGDGILLQVLKARQLGASTLTEALIAHRCIFYGNLMALIAGDVPEQSAYLFDMLERIYDNLPWWMRPEKTYHTKDEGIFFGKTDTLIAVGSGKSVRGGETLGASRGAIGRGKTPHLVHLSELSTWDNPEQIDDSLLPAVPRASSTLGILESTARGRGNWWHDTWVASKKGVTRFTPVFIPWYAESRTYRAPAPIDWEPSDLAIAHAKRAEEVSVRWCGKTIHLDRDQLFWWEKTRADAIERRKLHVFLAEYCADDMEAFQNTGRSLFPFELLHELRQGVKPIRVVTEVIPKAQISGLEPVPDARPIR